MTSRGNRSGFMGLVGPGVLVAATGVGAGDLAGAGFAGSKIGVSVAWAVVVGAALKYVLTEALARWQIATGTTVLQGSMKRLGPIAPRWPSACASKGPVLQPKRSCRVCSEGRPTNGAPSCARAYTR